MIQSLEHIRSEQALLDQLEAFRKKRNLGYYGRAGMISDQEAEEMIQLAQRLRKEVETWLRAHYRQLPVNPNQTMAHRGEQAL